MLNSMFEPVVDSAPELDAYAISADIRVPGTSVAEGNDVYTRTTATPAEANGWTSSSTHSDYLALWRAVYTAMGNLS